MSDKQLFVLLLVVGIVLMGLHVFDFMEPAFDSSMIPPIPLLIIILATINLLRIIQKEKKDKTVK